MLGDTGKEGHGKTDQNDAATSHRTPGAPRTWKRQERRSPETPGARTPVTPCCLSSCCHEPLSSCDALQLSPEDWQQDRGDQGRLAGRGRPPESQGQGLGWKAEVSRCRLDVWETQGRCVGAAVTACLGERARWPIYPRPCPTWPSEALGRAQACPEATATGGGSDAGGPGSAGLLPVEAAGQRGGPSCPLQLLGAAQNCWRPRACGRLSPNSASAATQLSSFGLCPNFLFLSRTQSCWLVLTCDPFLT